MALVKKPSTPKKPKPQKTTTTPKVVKLTQLAEKVLAGGHLTNKEAQERFKSLIQKLARAAHVLHG